MKIQVTIKPNSRHEKVEKISDQEYRVSVNAPPIEGRANEALIKILAKHFLIPKSNISICAGLASRKKIVEIV